MKDGSRAAAMLQAAGIRCVERWGRLFQLDRRRVIPFAPVLDDTGVNAARADELLRELGAWWVQWTVPRGEPATAAASAPSGAAGSDAEAGGTSPDWYAVICRRFVPVEEYPSGSPRYELRKGLKECRVERVSIDAFGECAFDIQRAAMEGYETPMGSAGSREEFRAALERERGFDDLRHYWLVRCNGAPVAYAKTILHDRREVDYTAVKIHPDYLKQRPSDALIFEMNRHYLEEERFDYASDGQRSLVHGQGFQTFLVRRHGFEMAPLDLRVRYARRIALGMKVARRLRGPLGRRSAQVKALLELDRLATEV